MPSPRIQAGWHGEAAARSPCLVARGTPKGAVGALHPKDRNGTCPDTTDLETLLGGFEAVRWNMLDEMRMRGMRLLYAGARRKWAGGGECRENGVRSAGEMGGDAGG